MNLTISGHHLDVTPALNEHITNKINKVMRRFDQSTEARVLLSIDNHKEKDRRHRAECTMRVKGNEMHAQGAQQDMYSAVDEMVDKLSRQLMKHKEKIKSHAVEGTKRMPHEDKASDDV